MDLDLEIISEEGDRPDPLFDSIMSAMNSMKEATADKIYQKIQKEGATNYSKPQVDRALANALKYGIFEVRNNRYRVRDDVLDDEDTVYWKLSRKRDQTPFRIQEDVYDRQNGPRLDPEKDNQRFRRPINRSVECPHCGRTKRPEFDEGRLNSGKKGTQKSFRKRRKSKRDSSKYRDNLKDEVISKRRAESKRKHQLDTIGEEKSEKRRKPNLKNENRIQGNEGRDYHTEEKPSDDVGNERIESQEGAYDTSDSEVELSPFTEYKIRSYEENNKNNLPKRNRVPRSAFSSECIKADLDIIKSKRSSTSIKTGSESEKTFVSSASDNQSQTKTADGFFEERPCTSRNATGKVRNRHLNTAEVYRNQYEREQPDQSKGNTDWLGCSDEPQGTIIQSNNVLTIEPMDSLAFKNPEQASYIS